MLLGNDAGCGRAVVLRQRDWALVVTVVEDQRGRAAAATTTVFGTDSVSVETVLLTGSIEPGRSA